MIRLPPRSTRTYNSFPTRRSSDLWNDDVSEALGLGYIAVDVDSVVIARAARKKRELPPSKGVPGNRRRLAWERWLRGTRSRHIAHRFWITPTIRDRTQSRSEEHTSELQSLMRISYAVFCLTQKKFTTSLIPS